jgi:hypothetical protein
MTIDLLLFGALHQAFHFVLAIVFAHPPHSHLCREMIDGPAAL